MKAKHVTAGLALAALMMASATSALAQPGMHHMVNCDCGSCTAMSAQVPTLTDEQRAEIQALTEAHRLALQPKQQELYAKNLELQALSGNTNAQPEYISQLASDIAALRADINQANADYFQQMNEKYDFSGLMGAGLGQMRMMIQDHHPEMPNMGRNSGQMPNLGNMPSMQQHHNQFGHRTR